MPAGPELPPDPAVGGGGGASSAAERYRAEAARAFQPDLDRAAPHTAGRWAGTESEEAGLGGRGRARRCPKWHEGVYI